MLDQIETLVNDCEKLKEEIEKNSININALEIINDVKEKHPSFYKQECFYQKYRTQFSNAYFSGSEWYVGDSYTEWFLNKPYSADDKANFTFCLILSSVINSINKKNNNDKVQ